MHALRFVVAGFAVALAVTPPARAQMPPHGSGPPLARQAALQEALDHNPALVALRRAADAAATRPAQETSLMPPMIEAEIWEWPIDTINPWRVSSFMFTLGQTFPAAGKRDRRVALMAKEAEMAGAEVAVKTREVIGDVRRAYAGLFVARKSIETSGANLAVLRQLAEISQAKYEAGRIAQQDVLKIIVEISRAHEAIVGLREQAGMAEAELNALLGRDPAAAVGPLEAPESSAAVPPLDVLMARALEAQPELLAARLAIERAEAAQAVAASEYRPDFAARGGYMLMPEGRDAWIASVSVTWPKAPWARKGLDAKAATARAEIDAARERARAVETSVRLAVHQAYLRVESAAERAHLLETSVLPQSVQVLDVSRSGYQNDRADLLDVLDTQRVLLAAQLDYWRALAELEQARADLERAVGADVER